MNAATEIRLLDSSPAGQAGHLYDPVQVGLVVDPAALGLSSARESVLDRGSLLAHLRHGIEEGARPMEAEAYGTTLAWRLSLVRLARMEDSPR